MKSLDYGTLKLSNYYFMNYYYARGYMKLVAFSQSDTNKRHKCCLTIKFTSTCFCGVTIKFITTSTI